MPIYEYFCEHCGHRLEALQSTSEEPLSLCPQCNQHGLKKLISAAGFRLEGSGWYETDFKSDNKRNLKESEKAKNDDKSGDKSTAKTETKTSTESKESKKSTAPAKSESTVSKSTD